MNRAWRRERREEPRFNPSIFCTVNFITLQSVGYFFYIPSKFCNYTYKYLWVRRGYKSPSRITKNNPEKKRERRLLVVKALLYILFIQVDSASDLQLLDIFLRSATLSAIRKLTSRKRSQFSAIKSMISASSSLAKS